MKNLAKSKNTTNKPHEYQEYYGTRPSALGMSDPIWGPLIHIFADEKKIEKDKDLDQVNCKYTGLRFLNF